MDTRAGVWFVKARGPVATTAEVGTAAIRCGLTSLLGLVAEDPDLPTADVPEPSALVFDSHDLVDSKDLAGVAP